MTDSSLRDDEDDSKSEMHEAPETLIDGQEPYKRPATGTAEPLWLRRDSVLPVLAVCLATLFFSLIVSFAFGLLSVRVSTGSWAALRHEILLDVMQNRLGFVCTVVPSQLAFIVPAGIAAWASLIPFRKRLGYVNGHWPAHAWFCGAIATPLIGVVSTIPLAGEESAHLSTMSEIFRHHMNSGFALPMFILVAGFPAVCEEFLFRGYIQTRFQKVMPPVIGIAIASIMFAAMHFDPVHVIGVLPIGLWLGYLRYASGSIYPSMLGHLVNNSFALIAIGTEGISQTDMPASPFAIAILACGVPALLLTLAVAVRNPPQETQNTIA